MIDIASQLRVGTLASDPPLQASKWHRLQVLLAPEELAELLADLEDPVILLAGRFYPKTNYPQHRQLFLSHYDAYIASLSRGELPNEEKCRQYFSAVLSRDCSPLYLLEGNTDEGLLRMTLPTIQVQHHNFDYSPLDNEIRSMVYGHDTVSWGLQFSYPQLYLHPTTKEICQTNEETTGNVTLFKQLQRWIRHYTLPTTFLVNGRRLNSPIRLGRGCLPWIHRHPQLGQHGLSVDATFFDR